MTSSSGKPWATVWALDEVSAERWRQDQKWGEQNHPDKREGYESLHRQLADTWKSLNDKAVAEGNLTWEHILHEEFYEAMAESDPEKLREELIQVAAVAVAWVEAIDRRSNES